MPESMTEVRCLPCSHGKCASCLRAWADEPCECACNASDTTATPELRAALMAWADSVFGEHDEIVYGCDEAGHPNHHTHRHPIDSGGAAR